jgi:hypothetical protein
VIEQLPLLTPEPARTQSVLKRCHDRLNQQRRRAEAVAKPRKGIQILERAIVAGLCAVYLSSVARDIVRLLDR